MNVISDSKTFRGLLIFFFAFGLVFPTVRVLLIGNTTSTSFFQYCVSAIPEFIVLLMTVYTGWRLVNEGNKIQLTTIDWVVLAFVASNVMLGFFLAQNIKLSLYGFRMSYLPMVFYFLIRFYDLENDVLEKTLYFIFLPVVFLSAIGLILYFFMPELMIQMILRAGGHVGEYFITRMTSLLWTPVVFGTFTIAAFLYFFYKAIDNDRWSNYLFMAILWSGTVLSVSRGAVISLFFGLLVFSFFFFRIKIITKTVLVMAAVIVLFANFLNQPSEFFKWFLGSSVQTVSLQKGVTRVELWKFGFRNLKQHPFGHGLGMTGHVGVRFMNAQAAHVDIFSTDGWFLKLANETGLWGLFSYMALSLTFMICFAKRIRQNKNLLLFFLLLFFVVFNIQNIGSNVLDFYLFSYLFWLLMGVAVNQYYKVELER